MSANLYWMPIPKEPEGADISSLKFILREKLFGGETIGSAKVGSELIPFLEGVAAVGDDDEKEDAGRLIAAINQYGEVQINLH